MATQAEALIKTARRQVAISASCMVLCSVVAGLNIWFGTTWVHFWVAALNLFAVVAQAGTIRRAITFARCAQSEQG
ncbi:hypothetical protein IVA80_15150 [Bradyrhizobium sp. 139]|uniref:hypothetical protein n=1 Tax=Bradyrhizobium sp. 139 TaxID=2782616 RepID=UPI001FFB6832|nr:hypothetical protein [Bradyrhizobium sp. 139]MCK1742160.1 hypothetical protein [Bradyrhizobium sp. 139]